jgi:hypothetical protein
MIFNPNILYNESGKLPETSAVLEMLKRLYSYGLKLFTASSTKDVKKQAQELRKEIDKACSYLMQTCSYLMQKRVSDKYEQNIVFNTFVSCLNDMLQTTGKLTQEKISLFLFNVQGYSDYAIAQIENL